MSVSLTVALLAALPLSTPEAEALDAVTVTASRRPQAAADVLAEVSVIERAQIEASGAPDLLELLRRQPGVDLARTGGSGQQTALFLRGGNSNHVLFLVDGVRVASANTGAAAFEHLPLDQVERIEIIRGPRASYFGSDAISGVIAITTREHDGPSALLRAGSHGRAAAAAAFGARGERAAFGVQVGGEEYTGFSATLPGAFGHDDDDDGYSHRNLGLRGRVELGSQRLGFSALATRQDVEFDQGETAVDQHALAATLEGPLAQGWMHRLTLGGARDDLDTPAFFARFLTRRQNLDWVHDLAVGEAQHLVFGANLQRERGSNVDTFSGEDFYAGKLSHHAGFVGWQGSHGAFDFEGALRHDDHEAFGGETTAQAAIGWRFEAGRVYANWGEGFRAPNLNELYSPGYGGLFAGNPDLEPERSRAAEIGLDLNFGASTLGVNAYRNDIDDLIAYQGGETFQAVNVARARIDGVEIALESRFDAWTFAANTTWQDARNADTGNDLLRRPGHKANLDIGYAASATLRLGAGVVYASERQDFDGELPSYALLDLHADWAFADAWHLNARLGNAFDREYSLASGFATAGRELIVTLRWQP